MRPNTLVRLSAGLFAAALSFAPAALAADEGDITMHVEKVDTPFETIMQLQNAEPARFDGEIDIGTIINLGKEIWAVIEKNQPVVNTSYDYATALPKGVTSAAELDGFSDLQYESWRMYGTNTYGMTVYDVTYTLVHQYGGSLGGKGQYLATVTVLPSNVSVLWGYKVDLAVKQISATNVGTAAAPVGSVAMELAFTVHTVIKHHESRVLYQFRGDKAEVLGTDL